jgi:hypothetical protein
MFFVVVACQGVSIEGQPHQNGLSWVLVQQQQQVVLHGDQQ